MTKTETETMTETLPAGAGWCPGCEDANRVIPGHFLCSRPPEGYVGGELEDGGWTAVRETKEDELWAGASLALLRIAGEHRLAADRILKGVWPPETETHD